MLFWNIRFCMNEDKEEGKANEEKGGALLREAVILDKCVFSLWQIYV